MRIEAGWSTRATEPANTQSDRFTPTPAVKIQGLASPSSEHTYYEYNHYTKDNSAHQSIVDIAVIVQGIATVALAGLAIVQLLVLSRTNKIYDGQKFLQETQFLITHRPKLQVVELGLVDLTIGQQVKVQASLRNAGETNAKILQDNFTVRIDSFESLHWRRISGSTFISHTAVN
jgi:hypothetical protein